MTRWADSSHSQHALERSIRHRQGTAGGWRQAMTARSGRAKQLSAMAATLGIIAQA